MEERYYRNEIKYEISSGQVEILKHRFQKVLTVDSHSSSEGYWVKSCYFDSIDDKALLDKLNGVSFREKYRLRYYNDDTDFIRLEKKIKIDKRGLKLSCPIDADQAKNLLEGNIDFCRNHPNELLRAFYIDSKTKMLHPVLCITYLRFPYIHRMGNVRITLDTQIRYSLKISDFFKKTDSLVKSKKSACILEVKFDQFLPDVVRSLIQTNQNQATSHSKYGYGRLQNG